MEVLPPLSICDSMRQDSLHPDQLYRLALGDTLHDRKALGDAVAGMIHKGMSANEKKLVQDILFQILQEAEQDLKLHLAEALAHEPDCPVALLDYLVYQNDFIIAEPVLRYSEALSDDYLIEIVQKIDLKEYRRTIAKRARIGSELARHLIATDDIDVFKSVLANKGTTLCAVSMNWLINVARHVTDIQRPLLQRPEITPDMAVKLYWYAADALRSTIAERFHINQPHIDAVLARVIDKRLARYDRIQAVTKPMMDAAFAMQKQNRITSRQVIETAKKEQADKMCCLWAVLLLVDPNVLLEKLDADLTGTLAVSAVATRFTRQDYSEIFMAMFRHKTGRTFTSHDINEAMSAYDELNFEKAQYIVHGWQCDAMKDVIV